MSLRTRLLAVALLASFALGTAACADITAPQGDCSVQGSGTCVAASVQGSGT